MSLRRRRARRLVAVARGGTRSQRDGVREEEKLGLGLVLVAARRREEGEEDDGARSQRDGAREEEKLGLVLVAARRREEGEEDGNAENLSPTKPELAFFWVFNIGDFMFE